MKAVSKKFTREESVQYWLQELAYAKSKLRYYGIQTGAENKMLQAADGVMEADSYDMLADLLIERARNRRLAKYGK